jgi:integrase
MRERRPGYGELRVYVGPDPVSGRKRYSTKSVRCGKREAQRELTRMVSDVDATSAAESAASRSTLTELIEEHIARHEGSPTTLRTYRSTLENHIRPTIGRLAVRDVDAAILDRFYEHLTDEKGLSPSSVHQAHAIIRGALRRAVRWGWAPRTRRDAAPPRVRKTETAIPSVEQVLLAMGAAGERDTLLGTFVRLAAATGARRGELVALGWRHVDLDRSTVSIEGSAYDDEQRVVHVKDTKNHAKRLVSLDPETVEALAGHRRRVDDIATIAGVVRVPDAFLFSHSADGSSPVSPDFFTSAWARLRTQVGLDGIRLRDLRHFQATMLLRSGVPVKNVSRRIGHRDAATTLNVYAHALEDVDREAADVVGGLLRSPARRSPLRSTSSATCSVATPGSCARGSVGAHRRRTVGEKRPRSLGSASRADVARRSWGCRQASRDVS